jgi:hypothetical protein
VATAAGEFVDRGIELGRVFEFVLVLRGRESRVFAGQVVVASLGSYLLVARRGCCSSNGFPCIDESLLRVRSNVEVEASPRIGVVLLYSDAGSGSKQGSDLSWTVTQSIASASSQLRSNQVLMSPSSSKIMSGNISTAPRV